MDHVAVREKCNRESNIIVESEIRYIHDRIILINMDIDHEHESAITALRFFIL